MPEDRLLQPDEVLDLAKWFSLGEPSERDLWKAMYGFDHDCRCQQDVEEDNMETVPLCLLSMTDEAMATLRQMRAFLFTIANTPIQDVSVIKGLAAAALNTKVVEAA